MIRGLDHLGIAVKSLEERLPFWADALALDVIGIETVHPPPAAGTALQAPPVPSRPSRDYRGSARGRCVGRS